MARIDGGTGTGNVGDTIIIGKDGKARLYRHPRDPRTPVQRRFRNLMRMLNKALRTTQPDTDADLMNATGDTHYWSALTFAAYAANHGTAIDQDIDQYGRIARCEE